MSTYSVVQELMRGIFWEMHPDENDIPDNKVLILYILNKCLSY